ncbi:MAG: DUF354 domain-containing protein [Candidatus Cloacimonetes bacterium]|nr:DUF354 domain-containing protein [Candidatus Cloacimonadota bacterium]MDD4560747.1 DUF354 domain-containing protein [Candidatus Cloacimonadota bacterium]
MNKTIWFDITNTPHINFFKPIIMRLREDYKLIYSLKDFAETVPLFEKDIQEKYVLIGTHKGKKKFSKVLGMLSRISKLNSSISHFDIKISIGGDSSNYLAKIRRKKSITFDDNETSFNRRYSLFTDMAFWPKAIPQAELARQGFKRNKLYQYDGFKEDIYVADYHPDDNFSNSLPFEHYVVVRPENLQANYIDNDSAKPITPKLLQALSKAGYNILYLPRYAVDKAYAEGVKNIYIPNKPINGLDACYYSEGVLTGAGTFAREAACLGVPSFSFFAGKSLLAVDKAMIRDGKMFFSRDVSELMARLKTSNRTDVDLNRSKVVQEEVITKLKEVIEA